VSDGDAAFDRSCIADAPLEVRSVTCVDASCQVMSCALQRGLARCWPYLYLPVSDANCDRQRQLDSHARHAPGRPYGRREGSLQVVSSSRHRQRRADVLPPQPCFQTQLAPTVLVLSIDVAYTWSEVRRVGSNLRAKSMRDSIIVASVAQPQKQRPDGASETQERRACTTMSHPYKTPVLYPGQPSTSPVRSPP
jgi:hypothetical protein